MPDKADIIELQDILHFFKTAGVDAAVTDTPINALASQSQSGRTETEISYIVHNQTQNAVKNQPLYDKDNYKNAEKMAAIKPTEPQINTVAKIGTDRQADKFSPADIQDNEASNLSVNAAITSQQQTAPHKTRPKPPSGHTSHKDWVAYAVKDAQAAQDLQDLKNRIIDFDGCNLKFTAKNTCIADGSHPSELMLIGEGPGAEEDKQAMPFVGQGGQLLNAILAAIHFSRESLQNSDSLINSAKSKDKDSFMPTAYITNAVFWRPPGNRAPTQQEIDLCRPYLERQIELVNPRIIISLGGVAATALLGQKQPILKLRGNWHSYKTSKGQEIAYMPSLHPAFLLRSPLQKKAAWHDFLSAKIYLQELEKN